MCGICGFTGFRNDPLLKRMNRVIAHRGIDDEGYYSDDYTSLGFRRLSIIDLAGGNQPLCNEQKTIWSICNGEIYNYRQLREELQLKGHQFKTNADTEILPHAYEEWGIDCLQKINGMFAVALWDKHAQTLFLARDRLGMRPLHYIMHGATCLFASEVKALMQYPGFSKELDFTAMDDFLTFRYIPGDITFFRQVRVLEPAHILTVQRSGVSIKKYWNITFSVRTHLSTRQYEQSFKDLLHSSVKECLISDVPVGVYLSGGLDSSVIAALVNRYYADGVTAFSHGFDGETDELRYARRVASFLGARHHEIYIQEKHFQLLPRILYHLDMPIANSDIIGFYVLAECAKEYVKVIVTGEGADELFGSYIHQEMLYYGAQIKRFIPALIRRKILPALYKKSSLQVLRFLFRYPGYRLDEAAKNKVLDYFQSSLFSDEYFSINSLFSSEQKSRLYSGVLSHTIHTASQARKTLQHILDEPAPINHAFNRLIAAELKYWLPSYHLMKEDKIAMSMCLESRYPYLDHKLVECMAHAPIHLKKRGLTRKYLLRKVSRGLIPEDIRMRPKGPILVPIHKCFEKSFSLAINEVLSESSIEKRGYFNYAYIKTLKEQRVRNPFLCDRQLFALMVLELWHRMFVDQTPSYAEPILGR
jgi:asparagine synthase (glutamine-hydrolysing)